MKRRFLLRGLPSLVTCGWLVAEVFRSARPAWALGGMSPQVGDPAPPFSLPGVTPATATASASPEPTTLALEDFRGRWLILYFYPKDFTPGCTLEARGFQRDLDTFHQLGAEVVGVSTDSLDLHGSFCGSEGLAYPLLSDPRGDMIRRYGSWLAPSALRHTFLIDPEGVVRARWLGVRPLGHSQEVIASLREARDAREA
jgi:peroxiredoxin Q/BCP